MEPVNYNAIVQDHNISLRAALAKSNTLPPTGGIQLPTLTNPAAPGDVMSGKEYINQDGTVGVGTLTVDTSGGGSVATCTVVGADYGDYGTESGTVWYQTPNGYKSAEWFPGTRLDNVLCNSFLSFRIEGSATAFDGGQLLETNGKQRLVAITGTAGGIVTIDIY